MKIRVNAAWLETAAADLDGLRRELGVGANAFVFLDGFGVSENIALKGGERLTIIEREKWREFFAKMRENGGWGGLFAGDEICTGGVNCTVSTNCENHANDASDAGETGGAGGGNHTNGAGGTSGENGGKCEQNKPHANTKFEFGTINQTATDDFAANNNSSNEFDAGSRHAKNEFSASGRLANAQKPNGTNAQKSATPNAQNHNNTDNRATASAPQNLNNHAAINSQHQTKNTNKNSPRNAPQNAHNHAAINAAHPQKTHANNAQACAQTATAADFVDYSANADFGNFSSRASFTNRANFADCAANFANADNANNAANRQNCATDFANCATASAPQNLNSHAADFAHSPLAAALKEMVAARNSPQINAALNAAQVGIAGLGGLGSAVAIALARVGVARLLLVDFDEVDPSNLNRQQYFFSDVGRLKTHALREILARINPFVRVQIHTAKITEQNAGEIFAHCGIVAECFDNPQSKAALINALAASDKLIVAASGLAGYGESEKIKQRRLSQNVWVCGDLTSGAGFGAGLMAPRVGICASFQANLILELLVGLISK